MTSVVESTVTEVLIEEAQGLVIEATESTLVVEVVEGEEVLTETPVTETVTEATIETLYVVEPEIVMLDIGEQGPAGPAGPSGGASYPGKTLVWASGKLTEVLMYSDATKTTLVERRVLNRIGSVLTSISFYDGLGTLVKTRTLAYSGGLLIGYTES